jgi:hypothetical protein
MTTNNNQKSEVHHYYNVTGIYKQQDEAKILDEARALALLDGMGRG